MYYARLSRVTLSDTQVIKKTAISSVTRSTVTAINRSDKIAGIIYPVSQLYKDVTRG
jgi:hypothetical protein